MSNVRTLRYGCLGLSIGDLIRTNAKLLSDYNHVLITALDSVRGLPAAKVGRAMLRELPHARALGNSLVLPARILAEVGWVSDLFSGFDEVWFFDSAVTDPPPGGISVLPPPTFDRVKPEADTMEWFMEVNCKLALGDGYGMNYLSADREVLRHLLRGHL